jgi:hypothetical protein
VPSPTTRIFAVFLLSQVKDVFEERVPLRSWWEWSAKILVQEEESITDTSMPS